MPTLEEVSRCPRCEMPGQQVKNQRIPNGGRVITLECRNDRCQWFEQHWIYQVRPDNSLVDPDTTGRAKAFPAIPVHNVDAYLQNLDAEIDRSMGR